MVTLGGEMKEQRHTVVQTAFVWFLRLMAAIAMLSGLSYWGQLIGLFDQSSPRFDQMAVAWQVPSVVLAVLLPCASMGLWMLTSWGIVLWTAACVIEIAIYGIWSDRYVAKPEIVIGHMGALAVLFVFIVIVVFQRYRDRANNY
ncbi:MAG: DUF6163 family protein [Oricola sp.]